MKLETFQEWIAQGRAWVETDVLTTSTGIQAGCIVVALLISLIVAKPIRRYYRKIFDWLPDRWRDAVARTLSEQPNGD